MIWIKLGALSKTAEVVHSLSDNHVMYLHQQTLFVGSLSPCVIPLALQRLCDLAGGQTKLSLFLKERLRMEV